MKNLLVCLNIALIGIASSALAQHQHINGGAAGQNDGDPLLFENGVDVATNSLWFQQLAWAANATYAGYFEADNPTFTSIGTGFADAPAPGAQLRLRFVWVNGPAGGSFGVWDVPGFNEAEEPSTNLSFSLPVGAVDGTNSILLSENNGEPGADPAGHIHGRHYSATVPGLYVVGVQLYDASTNGAGGGPIHTPSPVLPINFQAGVTISSLSFQAGAVAATFGAKSGSTYYMEAAPTLLDSNAWSTVAGPITGNQHLQTASEPLVGAGPRFYRLRVTTP